jgi:hypothetical protein
VGTSDIECGAATGGRSRVLLYGKAMGEVARSAGGGGHGHRAWGTPTHRLRGDDTRWGAGLDSVRVAAPSVTLRVPPPP